MSLTKVPTNMMGSGAVLQVVQGSTFTQVSSSSSNWVNTGLSATITPISSSSKVLVIVEHPQCCKYVNNVGMTLKLYRGATDIHTFSTYLGYTGSGIDNYFRAGGSILDSPATTSPVTYRTMFSVYNNAYGVDVQSASTGSFITLMEIAG